MTRNKDDFFEFVKNIASGTTRTSTNIDVDSINDHFANIGNGLASGSDCSNLGVMTLPKSISKTIFFYPTDKNDVFALIKKCKTTNLSGQDSLNDNLAKIARPVISDIPAVIFNRCIQL